MSTGGVVHLFLNFLLLCFTTGLLSIDHRGQTERNEKVNEKGILEMLHINKVSASVQSKPHPYMRRLYHRLGPLQGQNLDKTEGTVVQSVRMSKGPDGSPPGWIWFNITSAPPSLHAAELVLFRKTIYPHPLHVTVTLHSLSSSPAGTLQSAALEERQLSLDQRHPSGFDVFDVWDAVARRPEEVVGFQLRYKDERGSLVLHDALTQSLYCMDRGALMEPILVLYSSY